jgi:heme exporter protein D
MKSIPDQTGFSALDRLEQATHLLRATPARDYVVWLIGTGPFALGLLYFWADQSRSITAAERLPVSALGLGMLFLWARLTQSLFAARLHARLSGSSDALDQASWPSLKRFLVPLVVWQAMALALLPLALILVVPFPSYLAFQQSLIVTVHQARGSAGHNLRMALRQSGYRPQQTSGESSLLCVMLYTLPQLAKLLFGIESPVTLHPATTLNTTFAAAVVVLATLALDPLMKAVAVLRDFEMGSRSTGEDLLAGLRRIPLRGTLALLLLFAAAVPEVRVRSPPPHSTGPSPRY